MYAFYNLYSPGRAPDSSHAGGEKKGEDPMEEGVDAPDRPPGGAAAKGEISAAMENDDDRGAVGVIQILHSSGRLW